ncbi:MAG: HEPN domain-containing protein [Clostridiales Family XIII bacterium]|nr:HEPN domain-containing protein [Clostridiales Family XIII bacterium]
MKYELGKYRIEKAHECYQDALFARDNGSYNNAANRSYYCIFHSMRAVLALNEFDSKKHSGIIAAFNQQYIKENIFPVAFSEIVKLAFNVRGKSDYDDFYIVSKESVDTQIVNAKIFLDAIKEYFENQ